MYGLLTMARSVRQQFAWIEDAVGVELGLDRAPQGKGFGPVCLRHEATLAKAIAVLAGKRAAQRHRQRESPRQGVMGAGVLFAISADCRLRLMCFQSVLILL